MMETFLEKNPSEMNVGHQFHMVKCIFFSFISYSQFDVESEDNINDPELDSCENSHENKSIS